MGETIFDVYLYCRPNFVVLFCALLPDLIYSLRYQSYVVLSLEEGKITLVIEFRGFGRVVATDAWVPTEIRLKNALKLNN